ncbi:pyridoxamine 5 -phosphate oxidase-like fmn-binding protein [Malassezia pachydermatis]|uniref:Pyridoxamine 5-phosphate oxidase-like fmn-binding protein n=1 Tax=Malassezia pachydermatis TaxID=77020 RepID=A0A0N0RSU2_9BASI|nr:pyridoxamine 5 -phosphate oxidase-like fmn-binding protein [Malassezia pachydermatis]KOS16445.1 pyridoxamine 5 -phosphate oxidase-like fmn-binding protein [Malassezia pachydermatis]
MWKGALTEALAKYNTDRSILFYALATLARDPAPIPRVRYVVHRGFVNDACPEGEECDCLLTTTDLRSAKAEQILEASDAPVEIAWYIAPERRQRHRFPDHKLQGKTSKLDWDRERVRVWNSLSETMQSAFYGPPPGQPSAQVKDMSSNMMANNTNETLPENFALVVIDPKEVDMLDLQHARRTIFVRQEKRTWTSSEVAP